MTCWTYIICCVFLWLTLVVYVEGTNLFQCDIGKYYDGFVPSSFSDGNELKSALHELIDDHDTIPYSRVDEIFIEMSEVPLMITGVYSEQTISANSFPNLWNKEHVWPRSRGIFDSGADTSDLFHLYPASSSINSARGNKYFDDCVPEVNGCESPARVRNSQSQGAVTRGGLGSSMDSTTFAPPNNMKGDLARALFYMAVRYDGSDTNTVPLVLKDCNSEDTCGRNTFGNLTTLVKWHYDDPVDSREIVRVNKICNKYQGNRNPFVDFPELVDILHPSVYAEVSNDNFSFQFGTSPVLSLLLFGFVFLCYTVINNFDYLRKHHVFENVYAILTGKDNSTLSRDINGGTLNDVSDQSPGGTKIKTTNEPQENKNKSETPNLKDVEAAKPTYAEAVGSPGQEPAT